MIMKFSVIKNGKRIIVSALVLALTTGIFAGCGKTQSDKDSDGRTVISVGGWPAKEGADLDNMEARKAKFEQDNPDVSVSPNPWTFELKSFYAKAAGGQLPTVYDTHFTEAPQIISAGYSADLTDALKKYGLYDQFNKDVLDLVSKDGKVYAFPYSAYALGLAYNVDLFGKAGLMEADGTPKQPRDWDEVVDFAVKIKQATGKPGFVIPSANNSGGWIFTCLAWSFGAEFMKQDSDGKWQACFDSAETAAALQWIKDLKWKYDVLPANSLIDGGEMYKLYGTGDAAMLITAGDFPRRVTAYGMQPEQIGIMAMPSGPKKHVTLMGGSLYAVSDKATKDQIDASVRWIMTSATPDATDDFKMNTDNALKKMLDDNQLITVKSMSPWSADSAAVKYGHDLQDKNANANINHVKLYNDLMKVLGTCELRPEEPVCAQELYSVLDNCIQEVLTNKDADPAAVLANAQSDFQANYLDNVDY